MDGLWEEMVECYQKMGLCEEEIAKRLLCKTTKIIERTFNLDACDELRKEKKE